MSEPAALRPVCSECRQPVWGMEIQEHYDGILFWCCPDCRRAWPRFTEGRLAVISARTAAEFYDRAGR